ncbi:hypothetical protein FB451DRAFT_1410442 [Mycena latifolia]|nr:hypothetical protein FB451DRAFT_1410442 [Mycena latifolia]
MFTSSRMLGAGMLHAFAKSSHAPAFSESFRHSTLTKTYRDALFILAHRLLLCTSAAVSIATPSSESPWSLSLRL